MKTKNEIELLEKQAELYWKDVRHQADDFRAHFKTINWTQLLMIVALSGIYGIADKYWKAEEGETTMGIDQESLKNLLLDLIRIKLEESLENN